jgi:predicted transposase/invertase (TIGR01784 family)
MAIIPPDADILPPSDDHIFKTLLTHPNAKPVLVDVVSAATSHNIVSAQVLNFGHAQDTDYREIINRIIETKKEVRMASELLMEISKDEAERARIRSRKKFEMDQASNLITAEKRGRIEGKEEERRDNIRLMYHKLGLTIEVIAKAFGLSEQEVKNILGI